MPRRTALALTLALCPLPALAQTGPSLLELLSPNRIVLSLLQSGIGALRTQVDLKYGALSVDLAAGRVTMTDLRVWPLPEWDADGACEIAADRLVLRTAAIDDTDRLRLKLQLIGVSAPDACLPDEPRGALAMAGLDRIALPRLTFDIDYRVSSSAARVHGFADVDRVGAVDLEAEFAYVWIDGRDDMEEPDPVAYLSRATLMVENKGIWDTLKAQLPPQYTDPANAGLLVEGMVGGALAEMNRDAASDMEDGDPSALTDPQRAFLDSLIAAWPAFLKSPETLVVETGIDGDVYLDLEAFEDDPRTLFAALQPRVALAPARAGAVLPVALLTEALGVNAAALAEADRRRVGLALVTGEGAPRNLEAGFGLLNPIARAGDGAAALAMARALEIRAPEDGYRWALVAGAAGERGAAALMDRIEARVEFGAVLRLQNDVSGSDEHSAQALADVALIRDQAAMRLSGQGLARSYQHAAMWAMLAKAAGDPEAADILADIDERVRLAGAEAAEAWRATEDRASELATEAWIGQNLPATLAD